MNVSGQNENGDLNYSVKTMGELSLESSFFKEKKRAYVELLTFYAVYEKNLLIHDTKEEIQTSKR